MGSACASPTNVKKLVWLLGVAAAATVIAVPALFVVVTLAAASGPGTIAPTELAVQEIPPDYLVEYMRAPDRFCPGLPWTTLAAVGWVETRHGTLDATGVHSGANFAGAAGPMQFGIAGAAGNTWGGSPVRAVPPDMRYGVDGNSDGTADVYDFRDAIPAAAGYLCAHGAPDDIPGALFAYNHSDAYVATVMAKASEYGYSVGLLLGAASGGLVCPVVPPVQFTDTWHAPRPGGRLHMGQDLFAAHGQPLVAVANGTITAMRTGAGNGGTIVWLATDPGPAWYYAHLSEFAPDLHESQQVFQGQVIGFVGQTGNAANTPPHLHIQYRPSGRHGEDVNPYTILDAACPDHVAA